VQAAAQEPAAPEPLAAPKRVEVEDSQPMTDSDGPDADGSAKTPETREVVESLPLPAELSPPAELPPPVLPPAEPGEPYLVGPVGTWKPSKGYRYYATAEYILWWAKAQTLPPGLTLTLSNPTAVPQLTATGESGGRFFIGTWLTDRQDLAIEGGYFFLGTRPRNTSQTFPGVAITQKPIFDGIVSESSVLGTSTTLWGAEANVRYQIWRYNYDGQRRDGNPNLTARLDLLGGFRFVDLSESLTIGNTTQFGVAPVLLSDTTLTTNDSFGTHNHFYAGQIGADAGLSWRNWSASAYTKVAFGANHETVAINGSTQVVGPPVLGTFTVPGGFFTQPSNIGHFSHDQFSVLPEVGLNVAYKLGDHCRLGAGYTFFYMNKVVRPSEQVDVTAGGATRPPLSFLGGARPTPMFAFNESSFWAHGVNFTIEFSY
jgi:hypothetical protein